jgi:hypothetical protein
MSAQPPASIGFAAGLLGEEAYRMAVLGAGPGWVALDKPSGVAFEEHPWQKGAPTLLTQLRAQLEAGKPEMVRLGLAEPAAVFGPEPESAGIAIIADRATAMADWREALGSGAIRRNARSSRTATASMPRPVSNPAGPADAGASGPPTRPSRAATRCASTPRNAASASRAS